MQLQEIDGDEFRGVVKVKVGPITAQYKGAARLAEVDEADRRIVIDGRRDTCGQGNASAKILVTMTGDENGTEVSVQTDLRSRGRSRSSGGECSPTCRRSCSASSWNGSKPTC